jgi:hypothetical protein
MGCGREFIGVRNEKIEPSTMTSGAPAAVAEKGILLRLE